MRCARSCRGTSTTSRSATSSSRIPRCGTSRPMKVLGISGRSRQPAASIAVDGHMVAAVGEESCARVPGIGNEQTGGFPCRAVAACLARAGLDIHDVDELAIVDEGYALELTGEGPDAIVPAAW